MMVVYHDKKDVSALFTHGFYKNLDKRKTADFLRNQR